MSLFCSFPVFPRRTAKATRQLAQFEPKGKRREHSQLEAFKRSARPEDDNHQSHFLLSSPTTRFRFQRPGNIISHIETPNPSTAKEHNLTKQEESRVPDTLMQSSRNQVSNPSLKRVTESWDDDYEFHGNSNQQKAPSTRNPAETWDDAYEDEPMSNPKYNRSIITPKPYGTDEEVDSWGSGSDWSGDGDVEDLTRDSLPRTPVDSTLERHSTTSSRSSPPHDTLFSTATHSPLASPITPSTPIRSPISASFFSRISPVRKWKVRDDRTPKAPPFQGAAQETKDVMKVKGHGDGEKRNGEKPGTGTGSKFIKRRDSKAHIADTSSQRNDSSPLPRVFSGSPSTPSAPKKSNMTSSPISTKPSRHVIPASIPSSHSTTPPSSPPARTSIFSPTMPGNKTRSRSNTTSTHLPKPRTSFVSLSAHNLPLASNPNSSPTSHVKPHSTQSHLRLSQTTPRRSSLNDLKLKIPERISRAQRDIKRDMGDVKEFAACIEQLQNLQHVYAIMLRNLRAVLSESPPDTTALDVSITAASTPPRTSAFPPKKRRETLFTSSPSPSSSAHTSPSHPNPKPAKRKFSLSLAVPSPSRFFLAPTPPPGPQATPYATALDRLDATYGIWWECAEVLIELGGRRHPDDVSHRDLDWDWDWDLDTEAEAGASASGLGLGLGLAAGMTRGKRQRAVTLGASDEGMIGVGMGVSVSPPIMIDSDSGSGPPRASPRKAAQWRATTGRRKGSGREMTARQVALLKGMLEAGGGSENGGAGSGMVWDPRTIDCKEDGTRNVTTAGGKGKGTARGIRDIWKGLRRGTGGGGMTAAANVSPTPSPGSAQRERDSTSCDSSTSTSESVISPPPFALASRPPRTPSPSRSNPNPNPNPNANVGAKSAAMPKSRSTSKFGSKSRHTGTVMAAPNTPSVAESAIVSRRKQPLRRPSLAGIFGIGQKASVASLKASGSGTSSSSVGVGLQMSNNDNDTKMTERDGSSSDWDRVDLDLDLGVGMNFDLVGSGTGTPGLTSRTAASTTTSADSNANSKASTIRALTMAHWDSSSPEKPTQPKLALQPKPTRDLDSKHLFVSSSDDVSTSTSPTSSPFCPSPSASGSQFVSRTSKTPAPSPSSHPTGLTGIPLTRLALTPENIRPLLGHARDISMHLNECIGEVRGMMGGVAVV